MKRFVRDWWLEITLGLVLALAIFLLLEQMDIRSSVWGWLTSLVSGLGDALARVLGLVIPNTLSDLLGVLLAAGVIVLAAWRVRWRLMRSSKLTSRTCPRCSSPLKRIHRKSLDRVINKIAIPVHRYLCSNSECRWQGLRVDSAEHRSRLHEDTSSRDVQPGS